MTLKLDGIDLKLGALQVLKDLSLEMNSGKYGILLGPSGCGKTTLLNIVSGLIEPEGGRVSLQGRDITDVPPERRRIGYLFQDYALFPHLTVSCNIGFSLSLHKKYHKKQIQSRVDELLELIDLEDIRHKLPKELSGGQKQRVALARALAPKPELLLLDEPLSHVDQWQRTRLRTHLKNIQKRTGLTIFHVTHDQLEARMLADELFIMKAKTVCQSGDPESVFYHPINSFVAEFLGNPNVFDARVAQEESVEIIEKGQISLRLAAPPASGAVSKLGIDPDTIKVHNSRPSPPPQNLFACRILDSRAIGCILQIRLEAGGTIFEAHRHCDHGPLKNNQQLFLEIPPESLLVFPS